MGLDDVLDGVAGGTAWGFGVAMVAGAVLLVGKGGRPLAKQAIKGALILAERTRELTAEASEQIQDIYAEVRAELEDEGTDQDLVNGQSDEAARSARRRAPRTSRRSTEA